jgi:hypothetical protein
MPMRLPGSLLPAQSCEQQVLVCMPPRIWGMFKHKAVTLAGQTSEQASINSVDFLLKITTKHKVQSEAQIWRQIEQTRDVP